MNMAPVSSRRLEIRPDNRAVKNVSGMQVKVWREVENLRQVKYNYYVKLLCMRNLYSVHTSDPQH